MSRLKNYLIATEKPCISRTASKNLFHLYSMHMRSQEEEHRLKKFPQNLIDIKFLKEPERICSTNQYDVIFVVHSKNSNFKERNFLRDKYFKKASDKAMKSSQTIFVVSVQNANQTVITNIMNESKSFEDMLIIENVSDDYHRLVYKSSRYSPKHIVKMDDDVQVNIPALLEELQHFERQKKFVLCRVFQNGQISRNPQSKWFLSKTEYENSDLGLYCQGMAYVFSLDLLAKLYSNIYKVQYLWMDDWYVTHALMNGTGAIFFDISPHIISLESKTMAENLTLSDHFKRYQPLFGHFRPASM
ncbi:galactosyltransferase domain-containing protein [Ditylenchus destructor]|uniref:Hexosyltransferase n=1 Tax=Ditylenchus destructor TaxID=166010 RepID=A0AAD4MW67_9BILA|nr:galactosyltransferase domain-containing protein [Ditylenchus destructor]